MNDYVPLVLKLRVLISWQTLRMKILNLRIKLLLLTLIITISCHKEKATKLPENEKIENKLKINKKLIDKNPESYYYFAQRALILEILGNDKDAQKYYSKAREKIF